MKTIKHGLRSAISVCVLTTVISCLSADAQSFVLTGSMITARVNHTAALLNNGKVLITGGGDINNGFASAELYDPSTGTFTATGNMTTTREGQSATLLPNGNVLVAGGQTAPSSSVGQASAELYDPATGMFTATGNMTVGRVNQTATLLNNGLVLIAGGCNPCGTGTLASAELYNPVTGTFTATGSMTTSRNANTATLLTNGKVLVAGGFAGVTAQASAELYDPTTGTFTATGSMITARGIHRATLLTNGQVLIAAGSTSFFGAASSNAELYNPATGTFTPTVNLITPRWGHTATLLNNGQVLIAGGTSGGGVFLSSAELDDPTSGAFVAAGKMTAARHNLTATLLKNGLVLIAGGINGNALASAELLVPDDNTPVGSNIVVEPKDTATQTTPVTVAFSNVTVAGDTTLTISGTAAAPPTGFKQGTPPAYFQVATTAEFSGVISVCVNYSDISFGEPTKLRLFELVSGAWIDMTVSQDLANNLICGGTGALGTFAVFDFAYGAAVQPPINADGSSVFKANRGVVPVKFTLMLNGAPTCQLPAAVISVFRTNGTTLVAVNESDYLMPSDSGTNFRIDTASCQYVYNLGTTILGQGSYVVQISFGGIAVGSGSFSLK